MNEEPKPLRYLKGALRYLKRASKASRDLKGVSKPSKVPPLRYLKGASKASKVS